MVKFDVSVGVLSGALILLGILLTSLSNTGLGNLLALGYTRIVNSGNFVTVKEVPLPFFFSGVLATCGKRAVTLAAFVAVVRVFLLFALSYAGFKIHSVEYEKQGIENFNQERTLVKYDTVGNRFPFYLETGLFWIMDNELPQCVRWKENVVWMEKRLIQRDNTSVRIACSGDIDYSLTGPIATFELMRENATVEISGKVMRIYDDDETARQHVLPWTRKQHLGTDFYVLDKGRGSNFTGDKIVCSANGKAVSYKCDTREFLIFRENITELEPGLLFSTGFGRLHLFEDLNGTECLNIALRLSQGAGSAKDPIPVFKMLKRIIEDGSTTQKQAEKLYKVQHRSEMATDAVILVLLAIGVAILLCILGFWTAKCTQVLPVNSLDGLSKIYDNEFSHNRGCSNPTQYVTLGITDVNANQHFGSCKAGAQVQRYSAKNLK